MNKVDNCFEKLFEKLIRVGVSVNNAHSYYNLLWFRKLQYIAIKFRASALNAIFKPTKKSYRVKQIIKLNKVIE